MPKSGKVTILLDMPCVTRLGKIVAVNYRDSTRIQGRDSPVIQLAIQQVKITLELLNCLNCWTDSGVDSTFWIMIHSQTIQLLPLYQWQFQLPCIWYVISSIYQLNCYYASSYNISSLLMFLLKQYVREAWPWEQWLESSTMVPFTQVNTTTFVQSFLTLQMKAIFLFLL
jgi:hypothetical protein